MDPMLASVGTEIESTGKTGLLDHMCSGEDNEGRIELAHTEAGWLNVATGP